MEASTRRAARGPAGLLAAALLCASAAGEPQGGFGVESARQLVEELGPQGAAEQVSSDPAMLEAVAAGVASARREWLDVGVRLVGGADAYAYLKDRLVQAFSVALQHDPAAVLERGASGVPVAAVCAYDPFFGAEAPPSRGEFDRAVDARERVVCGVRRGDVAAARDACLAGLRQLRTAGASRYAR